MASMRVTKVEYSPLQYQHDRGNNQELKVTIKGVDRYGEYCEAYLMGTKPRFWVPVDPKPHLTKHLHDAVINFFTKCGKTTFPPCEIFTQNQLTNQFLIDEIGAELINQNHRGNNAVIEDGKTLSRLIRSCLSITLIEAGFKSAIDQSPLWCIYTKYPFDIRTLREFFDIHYQGDVVYEEAVRIYYDIGDKIEFPEGNRILEPNDIVPYTGHGKFPLRDYILDIEVGKTPDGKFPDPKINTEGAILAITLMENRGGKPGGEIYHGTIAKIDPEKVISCLGNSEWLKDHCDNATATPALIPRETLHLNSFYRSNELEAEYALLSWLRDLLEQLKPTHIAAHSASFDTEYIKNRAKDASGRRRGMGTNKFPIISLDYTTQVFDTLTGYTLAQENLPESSSLEYISGYELGYGKLSRPGIDVLYEKDPDYLSIYNVWDCVLLNRIDGKLNMISNAQSYADFHKTDISNYSSNMKLVETMVMNILKHDKTILPSYQCVPKIVPNWHIDQGGFVHPAPTIVAKYMFEIDNLAEYPMVIISGNIDHRTLIPDHITDEELQRQGIPYSKFPSGRRYRLDIQGIMPEVLKQLKVRRDKFKKIANDLKSQRDKEKQGSQEYNRLDDLYRVAYNTQFNAKKSMNAWFGVCGTAYCDRPFRLAHPGIGSDITEAAQFHLKWNKEKTESFHLVKEGIKVLLKVIYQDTDSCKVIVNNFFQYQTTTIEEIANEVCAYLNSTFTDFAIATIGTKTHTFSTKVETIYKTYLQWGTKKRYAYLDQFGKAEYRGVEIRRSSSTKITKIVQEELIMDILQTGDINIGRISKMVNKIVTDLKDGKHDRDMGQSLNVNSEGNKYGMNALTYSNKYLGKNFTVGGGKIVVYKVTGIRKSQVEAPTQVALEWRDNPKDFGLIMDYDSAIESFIKKPIMNILEPLDRKSVV